MNGKLLLDTNIVIAFINGETGIVDSIRNATGIYMTTIVLGELYFGAQKSMHTQENIAQIERAVTRIPVLPCDNKTAHQYGVIKNQLRQVGHPIPENDIWVAAAAIQHGMTLVTRDEHFQSVEDLSLEAW